MSCVPKGAVAVAAAILLASCALRAPVPEIAGPGDLAAARAKFVGVFTNVPLQDFRESEIPGIYEVYSGGQIIYYAADKEILIFGELYSVGGESLTADKIAQLGVSAIRPLDHSKALAVGAGPIDLVAFMDPDCGFCAAAQDWLETRDFANARLLVFFMPMIKGSPAYQRALSAACAPPELRREAMRRVFQPGAALTAEQLFTCADGERLLESHAQIAKDAGVTGTPLFIVKDQTVMGFRQDRLESLLSLPQVSSSIPLTGEMQ